MTVACLLVTCVLDSACPAVWRRVGDCGSVVRCSCQAPALSTPRTVRGSMATRKNLAAAPQTRDQCPSCPKTRAFGAGRVVQLNGHTFLKTRTDTFMWTEARWHARTWAHTAMETTPATLNTTSCCKAHHTNQVTDEQQGPNKWWRRSYARGQDRIPTEIFWTRWTAVPTVVQ